MKNEWIRRWGPAILLMAVIFIVSATPGSEIPKFGAWEIVVKKGGHMLGYALLAAAYAHALKRYLAAPRTIFLVAAFFALLYAASDEFHQKFTPGRTSSLYDVLVDMSGALVGLEILGWVKKKSVARSQESAS